VSQEQQPDILERGGHLLALLDSQEPGIPALSAAYYRALIERAGRSREYLAERILDRVEAGMATYGSFSHVEEGARERPEIALSDEGVSALEALLVLCRQLNGSMEQVPDQPLSLEQELSIQLQDLLPGSDTGMPSAAAGMTQLQSARNLQGLQKRSRLEQLMLVAAAQRPDTAGPLNPQSLVVRVLSTLHDLSPAYLARFITYARALVLLQRSGDRMDNPASHRSKKN